MARRYARAWLARPRRFGAGADGLGFPGGLGAGALLGRNHSLRAHGICLALAGWIFCGPQQTPQIATEIRLRLLFAQTKFEQGIELGVKHLADPAAWEER